MLIRIPGSSANLGPGFDCFGIGWQVYNYIEFLPSDKLKISGCPEEFQTCGNLAYLGYLATIRAAGIENEAHIVGMRSNIEIWSPENWNEEQKGFSLDNFAPVIDELEFSFGE